MTNEENIELCLKRLTECKTSDVQNFSYADTLAYIERLKAENAELRKKSVCATEASRSVVRRSRGATLKEAIEIERF